VSEQLTEPRSTEELYSRAEELIKIVDNAEEEMKEIRDELQRRLQFSSQPLEEVA
jgi:coenzyme F420-reducing hydrogenase alpha subunit